MRMDAGDHSPECDVHKERRSVLQALADAPSDPYLLGALVEYYGFGDQEAELCTCGWTPTSALAVAILGVEGDLFTDPVLLYERLRPFMSDVEYRRLGASLELCPIHQCDIRVCLDDQVHGEEVYG